MRSRPPQIFGFGRRDEPFLSGSGGRFSRQLAAEVDFCDRKRWSFEGGRSSLAFTTVRSLIFPPERRCSPALRVRGWLGRGLAWGGGVVELCCLTGFWSGWLEGWSICSWKWHGLIKCDQWFLSHNLTTLWLTHTQSVQVHHKDGCEHLLSVRNL